VTVYVPPKLAARARTHRSRAKTTNAAVVLDAIDAYHARLPQLLADSRTRLTRPEGSLFPGRTIRRRSSSERPVALEFWVTPAELEVIDALVAEYQAVSRTELVVVALDAYLQPDRDSRRGEG
jgi:hypothetical protein